MVDRGGAEAIMYADDFTLYVQYGDGEGERKRTEEVMKKSIKCVEDWCEESNMTLSPDKCTYTNFGGDDKLELKVGGKELMMERKVKLLGVFFTKDGENLFGEHVSYLE